MRSLVLGLALTITVTVPAIAQKPNSPRSFVVPSHPSDSLLAYLDKALAASRPACPMPVVRPTPSDSTEARLRAARAEMLRSQAEPMPQMRSGCINTLDSAGVSRDSSSNR
jgi:hypothetical protein